MQTRLYKTCEAKSIFAASVLGNTTDHPKCPKIRRNLTQIEQTTHQIAESLLAQDGQIHWQ